MKGTFKVGDLHATIDQLIAAFGEPVDTFDNKTDWLWSLTFPDGTIATIYNWKNGPSYTGDDSIRVFDIERWSVGGRDSRAFDLVSEAIEEVI
tara:strand:- start:1042 stop:1320 length:279 start_codon:yes stop_codon:yes gene_type:complete